MFEIMSLLNPTELAEEVVGLEPF